MTTSHLKIIVLKSLDKKAMSGYDLVKDIHSFTQHWKPSFGSIYPMLKDLHKTGLVEVDQVGRKKVYSITKKGRQAVKDISKSRDQIYEMTMDSLKNLELICDKKEIEFIHNLHAVMRNNFLPFKGVTKEMQEFTQIMMRMSSNDIILKREKDVKKVLKQTIIKMKKILG
jgi:DNA-binding PadR family transcriptional regulator